MDVVVLEVFFRFIDSFLMEIFKVFSVEMVSIVAKQMTIDTVLF